MRRVLLVLAVCAALAGCGTRSVEIDRRCDGLPTCGFFYLDSGGFDDKRCQTKGTSCWSSQYCAKHVCASMKKMCMIQCGHVECSGIALTSYPATLTCE